VSNSGSEILRSQYLNFPYPLHACKSRSSGKLQRVEPRGRELLISAWSSNPAFMNHDLAVERLRVPRTGT
jgi:hypothetical protein